MAAPSWKSSASYGVMISRTAVARDVQTGDRTPRRCLLRRAAEDGGQELNGVRVLTDGFEMAKDHALEFLDEFKVKHDDMAMAF